MVMISSSRFERHVTPLGHPERVERARVFDAVAADWVAHGGAIAEPLPATREQLERVHIASYLDRLEAARGQTTRMLDPDTFTSPDSVHVAVLAAGAAVQAAEHAVVNGDPAFALVRPPGHHAEADKAMGFCLLNNVAIAAAAMVARGLARIAIVDIDVHHGNGTQHIFYQDPTVLYLSMHQFPFYPGTGDATEIGERDGRGYTVNIPMEAGCGDADYALVCRAVVEPIIDMFGPQLLIVSAGYDAHERDPLASMRLTTEGYGMLVGCLAACARRSGSLALVTEGGYEMSALSSCLFRSVEAIAGAHASHQSFLSDDRSRTMQTTKRGERAVSLTRAALAPFWKGI
jgi:acetoin utilization deacetylase AcuC-like enzyme